MVCNVNQLSGSFNVKNVLNANVKGETYFSFIAPFQQRDNPFLDFIVPKRIVLSALWLYRRLIIQMISCYVLTHKCLSLQRI